MKRHSSVGVGRGLKRGTGRAAVIALGCDGVACARLALRQEIE